jgi:hypothetical protein
VIAVNNMETTKPWYASLTLWIAVAQGVAGILAVLLMQHPEIGMLVVAKSIVDIFIRLSTSQPIAGSPRSEL